MNSNNLKKEQMKIYTCPMHPEVIKDEPGSCPKCGMGLVEEKEGGRKHDEHADHDHADHKMKPVSEMSFWEKLKMSPAHYCVLAFRCKNTRSTTPNSRFC